jgi:hypothetical protein
MSFNGNARSSHRLYFLRGVWVFLGIITWIGEFELAISSVAAGRTFFFFLPVRLSVTIPTPYLMWIESFRVVWEVLFGEQALPESAEDNNSDSTGIIKPGFRRSHNPMTTLVWIKDLFWQTNSGYKCASDVCLIFANSKFYR